MANHPQKEKQCLNTPALIPIIEYLAQVLESGLTGHLFTPLPEVICPKTVATAGQK
jgi:hypothetical protein